MRQIRTTLPVLSEIQMHTWHNRYKYEKMKVGTIQFIRHYPNDRKPNQKKYQSWILIENIRMLSNIHININLNIT